jgi:hypothetical protein
VRICCAPRHFLAPRIDAVGFKNHAFAAAPGSARRSTTTLPRWDVGWLSAALRAAKHPFRRAAVARHARRIGVIEALAAASGGASAWQCVSYQLNGEENVAKSGVAAAANRKSAYGVSA